MLTININGFQGLVSEISKLVANAAQINTSLRSIASSQGKIADSQARIAEAAEAIAEALDQLVPHDAVAADIVFRTTKGAAVGEITVKDDETGLHASVAYKDSEDQPTSPPEGASPTWTVDNENVAVAHADDPFNPTFEIGSPGDAIVTADGLGLFDTEGNPILGKGTIHVTAGDPVTASIEFAVG